MEKTFETPGGVRLWVENQVGLVVVTARPGTDRTEVSLETDSAGAEELVEQATVECRPKGDDHIVIVKIPRLHGRRFLRRHAVTVRVDLPEGALVTVATASADIEINGSVAEADVKTGSGDISTDDVASDVKAMTASGHITMGRVGGDIRAQTASGDLRCSSVAGAALFSTASGDLEVGEAGSRVDVKATSGNVRLGEISRGARVANVSGNVRVLALGSGTLQVRSVSGDVAVGVVRGVDLHVDVETASGMVHSDIPLNDVPPARTTGVATRADLTVRTVSGSVEIGRALEDVA
jgi:DUF4097 and DUF4098 domain-containing protein YvlB